ncbi:DNA sulfur modification protein DndD [Microvirgula sp. AG722]|uniref:AAA family ATPase n=1 Tax=Microvirgula sp. AG722 TaxID=2183901 RepID=UPI000DC55237|nr:AAA family ATPase [Microvirgula sp. AG722]RAS14245.1 DNA sulfur modification protein DndD [Microvirgula sp. AG722]
MRFLSLEVQDIFAYQGLSKVAFDTCSESRNIVVISGRNGAGKTSLLNAIKLLFLGTEDEGLRRVNFGGPPISAKHFVLGQPGRWYGVFNTGATGTDARSHVALEWESGGHRYRAERSFRRTPSGYEELLVATIDGNSIAQPEELLRQLVPREVIPFFFFDGEQIQSIADAEVGREQAEIERLLGLSFVAHLIREVELYTKEKQRAGIPAEASLLIVQAENAKREAEARAELARNARIALENEVQELLRSRRRLDAERNKLRTGIAESDQIRMTNRMRVLKSEYERLALETAADIPVESPWLTNLDLVREALRALEDELNRSANPDVALRLHEELPAELLRRLAALSPPVSMDKTQKEQFHQDVEEALEVFGITVQAPSNPLLNTLSPRQVQALYRRFLVWSEKGTNLVNAQADRLRTIRQNQREHQQIQRDLDEAEITSDQARQQFNFLTAEIEALDTRERDFSDKLAEYRIEEQQASRAIAQESDKVTRALREFEEVSRKNQGYQLGLKVMKALEDYRQRRRAQIRQAVEARLNEHVGVLLGPSQLIKSVRLDDQFNMTYFDAQDEEVARRSISSGMRQLVAMSMLWALKDEANRPLPVIIDTPLGRIDRQNRALLMTDYFPHAGNPLVLLPTDSEVAKEDYAQLSSHIARRYEIVNSDGRDAQIVERHGAGA